MSRIGEMISSTKRSYDQDINLFNRWIARQISTDECIKMFLLNNQRGVKKYEKHHRLLEDEPITETEFEDWLGSIGWTRRMK